MKKALAIMMLVSSVVTFSETISQIQGTTHTSKYENKEVKNVRGVVTKIIKDKYRSGFYMQSIRPDKNSLTSEGIYVNAKGLEMPKEGNLVKVEGIVKEIQFAKPSNADLTVTSINASKIKVLAKHRTVIPTIIETKRIPKKVYVGEFKEKLNPRKNAMDYYESLEGMLVRVKNPVIVGSNEDRGQINIVGDNARYVSNKTNNGGLRYTYEDEQSKTITITDESIKHGPKYSGRFIDEKFTPNPGDKFNGAIDGVLTFIGANYTILNTKALPKIIDGKIKRDKLKIQYDRNKLSVVSYNIENFSIAEGMERVQILAKQVRDDLHTPDIIGLVEVGDDNGGVKENVELVSAEKTLTAIVNEIKKETGVEYSWLSVDPEHGKDGGWTEMHIRNAVLFRTDKLYVPYMNQGNAKIDTKVTDDGKLTFNPGRIGNNEKFFESVRKPVVAHLKLKESDKDIFVVVNHLKSKRSDDKIYSKKQPVKRGSELYRIPEGQYIGKFLKEINMKNPDAVILTMGDMNDFEFSPTLKGIKTDLMVSAVEMLPENERHTYVYTGNSQVLDNLLVNKKYAKGAKSDILNINSEFTRSQGYFSDHDPVYLQIDVR